MMTRQAVCAGVALPLLACLSLSLHAAPLHAEVVPVASDAAASVMVRDAWLRAMPPSIRTTAGYLVIQNAGERDDQLVGVRIDGVKVVEIHEMVRDGDTLAMRWREAVSVLAGGMAQLAPGGLHLMVIGAEQPLTAGNTLLGILKFRGAGEVPVKFAVRAP